MQAYSLRSKLAVKIREALKENCPKVNTSNIGSGFSFHSSSSEDES
jgi:hypothetical protein